MDRGFLIVWSEAALQDVESILEYIALRDDFGAATAVYQKLVARISTLDSHPERCRVVPELRDVGVTQYRELIFKPYRVCFRIFDQEVVIVSVLDGRRDLEQLLIDRAMGR